MLTTSKEHQVKYTSIEIEDAIILLPLMDDLVTRLNYNHAKISEFLETATEDTEVPEDIAYAREIIPSLLEQYNLLQNIGFKSSKRLAPNFDEADYLNEDQ